ncbi:MAG TPA: hypothetical protein VJT73_00405 [Polyangiaceae bacterium]|nr:hypothetical protein [Polyangiaceae bacterium]
MAGSHAADSGQGGIGAASEEAGATSVQDAADAVDVADAEESGAPACQYPLDNCDRAWLNGCETDLWSDANHCGRCGAVCDGVCGRRGCLAPDTLSELSITPGTPFAVTADYLYFVSGERGGPFRLSRIDELGHAPEVLADDLPEFSEIAASANRLYLWGFGENLRSSNLQGVLVDEGFVVSAVAPSESAVYAVSHGVLLARKAGDTTWARTTWFASEAGSVELWPIDVSGELVVVRMFEGESPARYEIELIDRPDSPDGGVMSLASGSGTPVRLRALSDYVYWLVRTEDGDSDVYELHRIRTSINSPNELLARGRGATDFALDSSFAYVTRSLAQGYQIEVISVGSISEKIRMGTRFEIQFPESFGGQLWFFAYDAATATAPSKSLRRVDLRIGKL